MNLTEEVKELMEGVKEAVAERHLHFLAERHLPSLAERHRHFLAERHLPTLAERHLPSPTWKSHHLSAVVMSIVQGVVSNLLGRSSGGLRT